MTESFAAPHENAPRADASNDEDELCSDRFKRGQVKGETASKNKQMSAAALKSFLRGCLCVQAVLEEEYDRDVCLRKRASRRESGLRSILAAVQIQRIGGSMNL